MFSRFGLRLLAALCVWAAALNVSHAQFYFITDYAGYNGSWTFYNTLADAQNNTNAVKSGAIPQLNLGMYITQGLYPPGGSAPNSTILTTNWYSSTNGTPGTGNTSNQSLGFFQLYNDPTNSKSTNTAVANTNTGTMTVNGSGANVTGAPGFESRFSPLAGLGFKETQGEFLTYAFTATASGLKNTVDPSQGFQDNNNAQGQTAINGSFNALFQNTGGNPALEGFYNINVNFNSLSTLNSSFKNFINPLDQFAAGSSAVVPEPASCLTFAMIFAASAGFGWRKSRQRRADAIETL